MYINSISIRDFRTFRKADLRFCHADRKPTKAFPDPKLANMNLLLGDNGLGKTTLLKAISLAALGPAVEDSGIYPYRLIRREPDDVSQRSMDDDKRSARIEAQFTSHKQDSSPVDIIASEVTISQRGDLERIRWTHGDEKAWHPVFNERSDAFFIVGYGATRRVEEADRASHSIRNRGSFVRAQRVKSLFEEDYLLYPLSAWLPAFAEENPGRHKQVVNLINKLMGEKHYQFTGEMEDGEYVFNKGRLRVPFPALSDGYRAYLGWIGDLIYHVCMTCPSGKKLVDNQGIVMVDEIDLHIHPKWQLNLLPVLAHALPNIQFIVTSHSPLLVGSLEWMNIILMSPSSGESSNPGRVKQGVRGLDADQILLTDFFGMKTTRAPEKESKLNKLTSAARSGNVDAAKQLIRELTTGMEEQES